MAYKIWRSELITPEYRINASPDAPPTFNLKDLGFPKNKIEKYGLKRSITFYDKHDEVTDTYIDPLFSVSWQTKFENGIPKKQIRRASWVLDDGSWSSPHESSQPIREPKIFLQRMRGRVIEELIDLADKFGLADKLKSLYENHPTEIYIYKEGGSPKFKNSIINSTEDWLTLPSTDGRTVRDVIVQYLSIGEFDDGS